MSTGKPEKPPETPPPVPGAYIEIALPTPPLPRLPDLPRLDMAFSMPQLPTIELDLPWRREYQGTFAAERPVNDRVDALAYAVRDAFNVARNVSEPELAFALFAADHVDVDGSCSVEKVQAAVRGLRELWSEATDLQRDAYHRRAKVLLALVRSAGPRGASYARHVMPEEREVWPQHPYGTQPHFVVACPERLYPDLASVGAAVPPRVPFREHVLRRVDMALQLPHYGPAVRWFAWELER